MPTAFTAITASFSNILFPKYPKDLTISILNLHLIVVLVSFDLYIVMSYL